MRKSIGRASPAINGPSQQHRWIGLRGCRQLVGADADQAEPAPVARRARAAGATASISTAARCVGCRSRWLRVNSRKSEVLSFSTTRAGRPVLARERPRATRSHRAVGDRRQLGGEPVSRRKVVSAEMLLVGRSGVTPRSSSPCANSASRRPKLAEPSRQLHLARAPAGRRWCVMPAASSRCGRRRADAVDLGDRQRRQERLGLGPPDHREAARLLALGGELGQELVRRRARSTR